MDESHESRQSPRPSGRRALALALLVPAAGAVAAAALLLARQPVAIKTPTPPPTPGTPTPRPTVFPDVFAPDDTSLGPSGSLGTIPPPAAYHGPPGLQFDLRLAPGAGPSSPLPTALPVWRIRGLEVLAPQVALRFPVTGDAQLASDGTWFWPDGLRVRPDAGTVTWMRATSVPNPRLSGIPRDAASAGTLAAQWLRDSGMPPPDGAVATIVQTSNGQGAAFAEWTIAWQRIPPSSRPYPVGSSVIRVSADGTVREASVDHPRIAGGAPYPLRSWQQAWADAQAGRWQRVQGGSLPEPPPGGQTLTITLADVTLEYVEEPGQFAVPVYAFHEKDGPLEVLVTALTP